MDEFLNQLQSKISFFSNYFFLLILFFFYRSIISNETQLNVSSDLSINEDISGPTKSEAMITEISEIHIPLIDNNSNQVPSRTNTKISREYLTQHIIYRAQRLASKVEPEMVKIYYWFSFLYKSLFSRQYENVVQQLLKNLMKQVLIKVDLLIHQN